MTLHDGTNGPARTCSEATWEKLPWYVNGSLPKDEVAAFEAEAAGCPACQAEMARLRALSDEVAETDTSAEQVEEARSRSWATIQAQIAAEKTARAPAPRPWFSRLRLSGLNMGTWGLGGVALVACVVVAFQFTGPPDDGFVTLTSGGDEPVIMVQPSPGTERALLEAALAAQGLTIAGGPTDEGLYAVTLPPEAEAEALSDMLTALPEVAFAAPGGS